MSSDPTKPDVGDLIIDASNLAPVVVDLPPAGRLGLRSAQSGCADALAEIRSNQPQHGVSAGIRDEDVEAMDQAMNRITEIDGLLPAARKLLELLEETRAVLDDGVQRRIALIASSVETRAKMMRSDDLLARYARTREYRSASALKGVRTRLRNQAEDEGNGEVIEPVTETTGEIVGDQPGTVGDDVSQDQ